MFTFILVVIGVICIFWSQDFQIFIHVVVEEIVAYNIIQKFHIVDLLVGTLLLPFISVVLTVLLCLSLVYVFFVTLRRIRSVAKIIWLFIVWLEMWRSCENWETKAIIERWGRCSSLLSILLKQGFWLFWGCTCVCWRILACCCWLISRNLPFNVHLGELNTKLIAEKFQRVLLLLLKINLSMSRSRSIRSLCLVISKQIHKGSISKTTNS